MCIRDSIYLVSAGAIFALDGAVGDVLAMLDTQEVSHGDLVARLASPGASSMGMSPADAEDLVRELRLARVIVSDQTVAAPAPAKPEGDYPLQALVLNITNQCNLACTYCYCLLYTSRCV